MSMRAERTERTKIWISRLKELLITPVGEVHWSRMTTYDNIGFARAHELAAEDRRQEKTSGASHFEDVRDPEWGHKWEYAWFTGSVDLGAVPQDMIKGRRIELIPDVGGEMLIEVNGQLAGSRDKFHQGVTLTRCANGDEHYDVMIEAYAGHGPRMEGAGPKLWGVDTVPEPKGLQVREGRSFIAVSEEELYQAYIDLVTLWQLYECLDPECLRAQKVLKAMFDFTCSADLEADPETRRRSVAEARKLLAPALACHNGSTAPRFSIFGQSHLDLAWLWTAEETRRKIARTYSNQLALLDEYPEYVFFGCSPYIFESARRDYPALFERIRDKVSEGRIAADGGMYVESDCNIPSGESLIRQIMYAKEWYRKYFDRDTELVWVPDCFGFNGQLPQIMKGCGIRYFQTQKLSRALEGCEKFPYNEFWWEGIDGSRILTHFYKKNNAVFEPRQLNDRWNKDRVEEDLEEMLFPFGYGDGGGGATRDMLEVTRRVADLEGLPRTAWETPVDFMRRLEERGTRNTYRGELYLAWHRGTLTSQARLKRFNRRCEAALREAELWTSIAGFTGALGSDASAKLASELKQLRLQQMFLQFHDILPGTSIERVNDDAAHIWDDVTDRADAIAAECRRALAPDVTALFNGLSHEVTTAGDIRVPSIGYTALSAASSSDGAEGKKAAPVCSENPDGTFTMTDGRLQAVFDGRGRMTSCRLGGEEFLKAPANALHLYRDINIAYDAWELASFYRDEEVTDAAGESRVIAYGTASTERGREAYLDIEQRISASTVYQHIVLREGSGQIEFVTNVNWNETHKLLRVEFPTIVDPRDYIAEIPFGYITRPAHRSTRQDRDRFECCMHRYIALSQGNRTVAVLNDCKYGGSADDGVLSVSLLKSARQPDMHADIGEHEMTYVFCPRLESFDTSDIPARAMELNEPVVCNTAGDPDAGEIRAGRVKAAGQVSYLSVALCDDGAETDSRTGAARTGAVIDTVKPAEDGSGDIIVRIYESGERHEDIVLSTCLEAKGFVLCDMLENGTGSVPADGQQAPKSVRLHLKPFEIVTLRIQQ